MTAPPPRLQDHQAHGAEHDRSRGQLHLGPCCLLGEALPKQARVMARADPFRQRVNGARQILAGALYLCHDGVWFAGIDVTVNRVTPVVSTSVDLESRGGSPILHAAAGSDRTVYIDCPTWIRHDTCPFCTAASCRHHR
jgi:hypothetical protein